MKYGSRENVNLTNRSSAQVAYRWLAREGILRLVKNEINGERRLWRNEAWRPCLCQGNGLFFVIHDFRLTDFVLIRSAAVLYVQSVSKLERIKISVNFES